MMYIKKIPDNDIYAYTMMNIFIELEKDMKGPKKTSLADDRLDIEHIVKDTAYTEDIDNLRKKYHNNDYPLSDVSSATIVENMEIATIGEYNFSYNDAIEMAYNLILEDENFYGILLHDKKGNILNPLHPVIADTIVTSNIIDINENQFNVSVFSFVGEGVISNSDFFFPKNTDFTNDIAAIVAATSISSDFIIKYSDINYEIKTEKNGKFYITYDKKIIDVKTGEEKQTNKSNGYIVPVHIMNVKGVAYPYYGNVYTTKSKAWNISPCYSANIHKPNNQNMTPETGSGICTKIGEANTVRGISALNHSNHTSPLNSMVSGRGFGKYSKQSAQIAFAIYDKEIEEEPQAKEEMDIWESIVPFEQYRKLFPDTTKMKYIKYLKEFKEKKRQATEPQQNNEGENNAENNRQE